jgi:hypothetical protein
MPRIEARLATVVVDSTDTDDVAQHQQQQQQQQQQSLRWSTALGLRWQTLSLLDPNLLYASLSIYSTIRLARNYLRALYSHTLFRLVRPIPLITQQWLHHLATQEQGRLPYPSPRRRPVRGALSHGTVKLEGSSYSISMVLNLNVGNLSTDMSTIRSDRCVRCFRLVTRR